MTVSLRALPTSLVVLAALLAPTAIRAQSLCHVLANHIKSAEPAPDRDNAWISPTRVLAGQPNAWIHLDEGTSAMPLDAAIKLLKSEFHASARLLDAVTKLVGTGRSYVRLHRFGSSELRAAKIDEGSAGCQFFVFFTALAGHEADVVDPPPELAQRKEGDPAPCGGFGSLAFIGQAGDTPAFIFEESRDLHERISLTPWHDGWQKACEANLDFSADIDLTERFCARDVDCPKASEQLEALARRYDRDAEAFASDQGLDEALKGLKKRADAQPVGSREFPSFGQQPQYDAPTFSETTVTVPIMVEGQAMIAKIGHGSIGWRTYPDYLVGLYRPAGDGFEAVAGVVLTKKRSKPVEITVK